MDHLKWYLHMDEGWMWRWYITNSHGEPFAISEANFFRREDALRNLKGAQMALSG